MDANLENKLILVADDDEQFGAYVQALLDGWGCCVLRVGDGVEGLRLVEHAHPDLVLTDLSMPMADGLELIMAIRRIDSNLPIIAMSGAFEARTNSYLGASKKLGANADLAKPFTADQLRETMIGLLSAKPAIVGPG